MHFINFVKILKFINTKNKQQIMTSSSTLPSKLVFTLDHTYKEERIEDPKQEVTTYMRYRSKQLPDYVFVYRPDTDKWSVRKDKATSKNSNKK